MFSFKWQVCLHWTQFHAERGLIKTSELTEEGKQIYQLYWHRHYWLVVWNMNFYNFPQYMECHHPTWRTPSFFRGVGLKHQADDIPSLRWWSQRYRTNATPRNAIASKTGVLQDVRCMPLDVGVVRRERFGIIHIPNRKWGAKKLRIKFPNHMKVINLFINPPNNRVYEPNTIIYPVLEVSLIHWQLGFTYPVAHYGMDDQEMGQCRQFHCFPNTVMKKTNLVETLKENASKSEKYLWTPSPITSNIPIVCPKDVVSSPTKNHSFLGGCLIATQDGIDS